MRIMIVLCALITLAGASVAQIVESGPVVDMIPAGSGGWSWALTQSGDLFLWSEGVTIPGHWEFKGNIAEAAGIEDSEPFVSVLEWVTLMPVALTVTGRYFFFSRSDEWLNCGLIAESAGVPADGTFVALSRIAGRIAAVTTSGQIYRAITPDGSSEPEWEFFSSIGADTGVVGTEPSSLGHLKSLYR